MSTTELATVDQNPMVLLATAVENGADPDQLEKLLALQERWEKNQAEKAFNAAMQAAQQEMPVVVKTGQNAHTKTKYALLESVQKQCKPVYQKHGLSLSFGEADCPVDRFKRTTCDVRHIDGACHTYHLDLPVDSSGAMNAVQGAISTTSYAQRRLVCMIFNVTIAGEDTDGATPSNPISGAQVEVLNKILDAIHPDDDALGRMLNWAGVDSLDKLPQSKFAQAKSTLETKARAYQQ